MPTGMRGPGTGAVGTGAWFTSTVVSGPEI